MDAPEFYGQHAQHEGRSNVRTVLNTHMLSPTSVMLCVIYQMDCVDSLLLARKYKPFVFQCDHLLLHGTERSWCAWKR